MRNLYHKFHLYGLALVVMMILFDSGLHAAYAATITNPTYPQVATGVVNKVYFPDQGQFVANPLLRYWRINGRFANFGVPVSRSFVDNEGHTVQFFQKMALAYYPENAGTAWENRPYQLGTFYIAAQPTTINRAWPFARTQALPATTTNKYFPESGHNLANGFLEVYNRTGGLMVWGYPLSEEYAQMQADGKTYNFQIFERGRMRWQPKIGAEIDPNFGAEMAAFFKANTTIELNNPVAGQARVPNYSSWVWEHWVDVNLTTQSEIFYEGDVAVRWNLVTTGKKNYDTPTGTFHVIRRVYNERMRGGSIGSEEYYDLSNVLFTQYFTNEGHALHYAWWREQFGVVGSHGCVNMNYASSEFAWNWMVLGSRINIHY